MRRSGVHETFWLTHHLLLEQAINKLLEEALEKPQVVHTLGQFSVKLKVVEGLGLLDSSVVAAIRSINKGRNDIAHKLDASVGDEFVDRIYSRIPEDFRSIIESLDFSSSIDARMARHFEENPENIDSEAFKVGYRHGSTLTERIKRLFLSILIIIGHKIHMIEYENKYDRLIFSYHLIVGMRDMKEDHRTPEEIWDYMDIPAPPHPRDGMSAIFGGSASNELSESPKSSQ